jgi:hypothetical protein
MQKLMVLVLFVTITSLIGCSKSKKEEGHTSIVGKWKLKEYKLSPGTPVIDWTPASSDIFLEFTADGKMITTGVPMLSPVFDRYSVMNDSMLLIKMATGAAALTLRYNHTPSLLTIHYPCIEECTYRYTPVNN